MEKIQKSPLRIIGTDQFELTEREVERALKEARQKVQGWRELLMDSDEELRKVARKGFLFAKRQETALSESPGKVLARAKTFYDKTAELSSSDLEDDQLALQLDKEFPDLMNFCVLLHMTPWGYHLEQFVTAVAVGKIN